MAHAVQALSMLMTPEEFLMHPTGEGKAELVRGEVRVMSPAGGPHGRVATNLILLLAVYVSEHQLGYVFSDSAGYELAQLPRTVRAPDVSFVRADRMPPEGVYPGFIKLAPDLAVEVLSPSERAWHILEKIDDYFTCGTAHVWVIDPVGRTVMVVAINAPLTTLHESDDLIGGDVVPGFSCQVADLFKGVARRPRTYDDNW